MRNNKTIAEVVKNGLCTGCGTCVGICPNNAVEMTIDHRKGIYVPHLDKEKCNQCGLCFEVCPGHAVNFKQLNLEIFGREPEDSLLGNYLNCCVGYSTDYDIRYDSTSGGLVTQLLIFALHEGMIDGALVTRMRKNNPLEPEPFIARTREEIIEASKAKYCPVPANIALKEILNSKEGGKVVVVGLPCHIHGVRKAMMVSGKLREKIVLLLGLFCNHTPSFLATDYILYKMKVKREQVKRFNYRGGGSPGTMKISLESGELLSLLLPDYWGGGFGSFFYPLRCLACIDALSELADISFGDAWLPEFRNDKAGTSIIVSRTQAGEQLLQSAISRGVIELNDIKPIRVVQAQSGLLNRKKAGVNAYISISAAFRRKMPVYAANLPKPQIKDYFDSMTRYLRVRISTRRISWRLIKVYTILRSHIVSSLSKIKSVIHKH